MDSEKTKQISDFRASLGSFSNFGDSKNLDDLDDPISAYFKQRCGNTSKTYFKKQIDSDSDTSFGLIDLDHVSLFGNGDEENQNQNFRFSELILEQIDRDSLSFKKKQQSDVPKVVITEVETELDRQRALARKALSRLSSRKSNISPNKTESKTLTDISSKLMNVKLYVDKGVEQWFQPNSSPNTPRFFKDELNSLNGEDESISNTCENKAPIINGIDKNRESQYVRKVNSMFKELTNFPMNSDLEFESQTKEEQINMFEEEEKKFKLENFGLLHNSQISQFSGVGAEDILQGPFETSDSQKERDIKNLSIGQFFNLRSNRVSSLVGSATDVSECLDYDLKQSSFKSTLNEVQNHLLSKSDCIFPTAEKRSLEKTNFRRCVSNLDLKQSPDIEKNRRNSIDSCSSSSTLMIQDLIAGFGPGLSDTEMCEKLMHYKEKKIEEKHYKKHKVKEFSQTSENNETPKSSKMLQQKNPKSSKKKHFFKETYNEFNNLDSQKSIFYKDKKFGEVVETRIEKIKKFGSSKGFFASTPKSQAVKFQEDRSKTFNNKVLMNCEDWGTPRVHSIQPLDLGELAEDHDKTVTMNSISTCSDTKKVNDTVSIEDTIVAGDLTVLSQRIEEMKQDTVCIVRSNEQIEPILLTVVQKLSHYPKGSVDCSALTPLIRDQFPELLAHHENQLQDISVSVHPSGNITMQDDLAVLPGSSVKFPEVWGLKQKIYACADLKKTILIPILNISHNWFLVSLENLELVGQQGKKFAGAKKNDELCVMDFVSLSLKKTFLPPENQQYLKVFFKSKVVTKLEMILTFFFKDLMSREFQKQNLRLLVTTVNPENHINVLPKDPINFGVIADQCFDHAIVQVSFDGICRLPLTIYIEDESDSGHFILKPVTGCQRDQKYKDNICCHEFQEGEKQMLEFWVCFQPNNFLKEDSKTQDFQALLVLMLGGSTDSDGILRKIPVKGSVGHAHFLCNFSCCPLVFKASERGQSVTRTYPLKNIGSIPIAFTVSVISEDSAAEEEKDLFVAPKSFYLAKDEETGFNVIFNAFSNQDCVKRFLRLQVKPNGRVLYETELIGIVVSLDCCRPISRTSESSVSTKLSSNTKSVPVKLRTTCRALSWTAVALENEARQSCQIKILSSANASIRVTFERNSEAFKLVNENGEKVHKLRRTLMPDCPFTLTVVFRPDVVGAHNNALKLEINRSSHKYTIALNGIGGIPNLEMKNVKTDLIGCKILSLQYSHKNNEFESMILFKNKGRVPSFVYLMPGIKDFSLSHELTISPSSAVISPDSTVSVKVSQKLKNRDLQQLLCDREIRKVATISLASGDEPSRQRLRNIVNSGKVQAAERYKKFTAHFLYEKELNLKNFEDSLGFEETFLKSLSCLDIAVVVEKGFETSFLEETADEFISFCSDGTVIHATKFHPETGSSPDRQKFTSSSFVNINDSVLFGESISTKNKINKWLDTLEYHKK